MSKPPFPWAKLDIARFSEPEFRDACRTHGPLVGHTLSGLITLAYRAACGGRLENPTTGRPYALALIADHLVLSAEDTSRGLDIMRHLGLARVDESAGDPCWVLADDEVPDTRAGRPAAAAAAPAAGAAARPAASAPERAAGKMDVTQRSQHFRARQLAERAAKEAENALGAALGFLDDAGRNPAAWGEAEIAVVCARTAAERAERIAADVPDAGPGRDTPSPADSARQARRAADLSAAALAGARNATPLRCSATQHVAQRDVAVQRNAQTRLEENREDETTARAPARETRLATAVPAVADQTDTPAPLRFAPDDTASPLRADADQNHAALRAALAGAG